MNNEPSLDDLRLFAAVARNSSFVAAARELGTSQAYVSKRIAALETQLRVKLFHRTTRRVRITDEGEAVFQWTQRIVEDVEGLTEAIAGGRREPRGLLRISTSQRLGRNHVAPILAMLKRRHPALEVWLELLDRRVDLLGEGFDIDIRVGAVHEPHLIAHRIAESRRILVASPSYVARRGMPATLAEVAQHDCLLFRDRDSAFGVWQLEGPKGLETVKVTGRMASNHSDIVRLWALEGEGIIMVSVWDAADSLASGALVNVLPAYRQPADVWAVSTARLTHSAKVRVCVQLLQEQLTAGPYALVTTLG